MINLIQRDKYKYVIDSHDSKEKCVVFANTELLPDAQDDALKQLENVSKLPGIIYPAIGMPDIHGGYGFPIGGVAAFDLDKGVICPGGVGYDINCGVRMYSTNKNISHFKENNNILDSLYKAIPSGLGSSSRFKLSNKEILEVLMFGAKWCVKNGMGTEKDLKRIEDGGSSMFGDPDLLSKRAIDRGMLQLGTLGSGNHFIELQYVDKIYDREFADFLGLKENTVTLMIHTGSRGLGYQVCDDYLKIIQNSKDLVKTQVNDRQLVSVPVNSKTGKDYYGAMMAAANYAWANRQKIGFHVENTLQSIFTKQNFQMDLIYDVAHNLARRESFYYKRRFSDMMVHRKGATRALPPGDINLPEEFQKFGQPVIIPGDMGTYSYILKGVANDPGLSFYSVCHGAGRRLSRKQAIKQLDQEKILSYLRSKEIKLIAASKKSILEEAPVAYKNINRVIDVIKGVGLADTVARMKPFGVIKG